MNVRHHKLVILLMVVGVWPACGELARVELMYVNGFTDLDPLVDADGVPLTAGGPANDDGAIIQVGYFQGVSHLLAPSEYSEAEWTRFTPLTGKGSLNADRHPTSIGAMDSRASGPFGFFFYPAPVAVELDTERDAGIPVGGDSRLGLRFWNGVSMAESTHYNIVTSGQDEWVLGVPEESPSSSSVLDLDHHALVWASGAANGFRTSLAHAPEPGVPVLGALAGLAGLWWRRIGRGVRSAGSLHWGASCGKSGKTNR